MKSLIPESDLDKHSNSLFSPLGSFDCSTMVFSPGGGRRTLMKLLFSDEKKIAEIAGSRLERSVFIHIYPDRVLSTSNEAYLKLILNELVATLRKSLRDYEPEESDDIVWLINKSRDDLIELGYRPIYVLHNFEYTSALESSIYSNLEMLMGKDKSLSTFIFLSSLDVYSKDFVGRMGNFKYAVTQYVSYYPLFDDSKSEYVLRNLAEKWKVDIDDKAVSSLIKICGGHPQLLKYSLSNLSKQGLLRVDYDKMLGGLVDDAQIRLILGDIWDHLSIKDKRIMESVVSGSKLPSDVGLSEYLKKLRLTLRDQDGKLFVFSPLMDSYIRNTAHSKEMRYDLDKRAIFFGNKNITDKFTSQEYRLVSHFLNFPDEVVTRDDIASVLWGARADEKYSDWHIDKLISVLRKKLNTFDGYGDKLVTLKGEGYMYKSR